ADIFKNNCLNIGVLPVQVSPAFLEVILEAVFKDPTTEVVVDLPSQTIRIPSTGDQESFDINVYKKDNMLNGFDDIDYLRSMEEEISSFADNTPL
ncbi:3-isopropylmalate dehydratase small subunit, partial [Flavobacteriaceae bacterium]|nr:3-isopropylmalate dehydratase small subunit [Flavobacteriaceae bacterium]